MTTVTTHRTHADPTGTLQERRDTCLADIYSRLATIRDDGHGMTLDELMQFIDESFERGARGMADAIQTEMSSLDLADDPAEEDLAGNNIIHLAFPPSDFIRPWGTSHN